MTPRVRAAGAIFVLMLMLQGGRGCALPLAPSSVTSVTYIYEQRQGSVPKPVEAGLNKLNRQGIVATSFDQHNVDGDSDIPDQYKLPLAATKDSGIPALVVMAGEKVRKVVKAPTTEEQVLEAAK